jgi:type II secretory ATPase GspE/PulE/Tfp pilus assembly ATPase PilB-like protein
MKNLAAILPRDVLQWLSVDRGFEQMHGRVEHWPHDEVLLEVADRYKIPVVPVTVDSVDLDAFEALGELCLRYRFLPTFAHSVILCIVTPEPFNQGALRGLRHATHKELRVVGCTEDAFDKAIADAENALQNIRRRREIEFPEMPAVPAESWRIYPGNMERTISEIVENAYRTGAGDIQIQPTRGQIDVRFLYESDWEPMPPIERQYLEAIVKAFREKAGLSELTDRRDQSGKAEFVFGLPPRERRIDFRIEICRSTEGDALAGRILDQDKFSRGIPSLPFAPADNEIMRTVIKKNQGVVLFVGPTGSGKTTLLYKCLKQLDSTARKIFTVEDPPEYTMHRVVQYEVGERVGFTFAEALKSLLRQKPNVIMVGETRDKEVAHTVIEAGLGGHLILTTLHTQDAVATLPRLLEMGVAPNLIQSVVLAIVGQRLVACLCPNCKRAEKPSPQAVAHFKMYGLPAPDQVFVKCGCHICGRGTVGKEAIYEIFYPDDTLRKLIVAGMEEADMRKAWLATGAETMIKRGLRLVADGLVEWEEVSSYERSPIVVPGA